MKPRLTHMICVGIFVLLGVAYVMPSLDAQEVTLSDLGVAPELHEGIWLNTTTPLKLENLRGKVVLLEMWTFDCINCIHTLPTVKDWWETYQSQGLVVIGNHMPEFGYEADLDNLRQASVDRGLTYPIIQDNDRLTWDAYHNRYWPTMYVIDKQGHIRYYHIGEGAYVQTEQAIQQLLAEPYDLPEITPEPSTLWSLSANEELNVRSDATITSDAIGRILPNEAYYILSEKDGWYQIAFNGKTAYVSGEFVTVTGGA